MTSKHDQLSKLNVLLESGVLTQEEFDAAKRRVINSQNEPKSNTTVEKSLNTVESSSPIKYKRSHCILIGIGIATIILAIAIIALCGNKDSSINENSYGYTEESPIPSDKEQIAALEKMYADTPEASFEERFELMNPWHKGYFKNEWGEDNPNQPYIYTTLSGAAWNIHIGYESAQSSQTTSGVFGLYIMDSDGKTSMFGPVNILVRGSDGETMSVPVTDVSDGVAYIADPGAVEGLKVYLNSDQFDILMEFDKYNERHKTQAHWWSESGFFQHAIDTML